MYRSRDMSLELFLAHPGGPYWAHKDAGSWTIPKGEVDAGEDLLEAARREFEEETSVKPIGPFLPLRAVKLKSGKIVHAWAFEGDCDPGAIVSNTYKVEWPPKSGKWQSYPEIDRCGFFGPAAARDKLNVAQGAFVDELVELLGQGGGGA
jgi:predicted NUDIX family NTP pyrophosphohydrolase